MLVGKSLIVVSLIALVTVVISLTDEIIFEYSISTPSAHEIYTLPSLTFKGLVNILFSDILLFLIDSEIEFMIDCLLSINYIFRKYIYF